MPAARSNSSSSSCAPIPWPALGLAHADVEDVPDVGVARHHDVTEDVAAAVGDQVDGARAARARTGTSRASRACWSWRPRSRRPAARPRCASGGCASAGTGGVALAAGTATARRGAARSRATSASGRRAYTGRAGTARARPDPAHEGRGREAVRGRARGAGRRSRGSRRPRPRRPPPRRRPARRRRATGPMKSGGRDRHRRTSSLEVAAAGAVDGGEQLAAAGVEHRRHQRARRASRAAMPRASASSDEAPVTGTPQGLAQPERRGQADAQPGEAAGAHADDDRVDVGGREAGRDQQPMRRPPAPAGRSPARAPARARRWGPHPEREPGSGSRLRYRARRSASWRARAERPSASRALQQYQPPVAAPVLQFHLQAGRRAAPRGWRPATPRRRSRRRPPPPAAARPPRRPGPPRR